MTQGGGADRRRWPRVSLNGEVQGRIHTVAAAPVIDLSENGALLEVPTSLRPGSVYALRLPATDAALALKSRVVRSSVHGFAPKADGESLVLYRVAVEFVELTTDQRFLLQRTIAGLGGSFDAEFGGER